MTRQAIIAVALKATTSSGTSGLALRDIGRQLGVSLQTIQRHFATKDELWRACVDAVISEVPLATVSSPPGDPVAVVTEHLHHQIERAATRPGISAAMWNDTGPGAEARLAYLTEHSAPIVARSRERLEAGIANNVLRPIDPEVFLAVVILGLSSLASSQDALRRLFDIDLDNPEARTAFANTLADLLLHGLLNIRSGSEGRT